MKKIGAWILLAALLTGCGAQQTFETVADEQLLPVSAAIREISLSLPKEAGSPVMQTEEGSRLYLCDGYSLTVQTAEGGDLNRTLTAATGFTRQQLQILQTQRGDAKCYETVWTSAGESGPQVGRLCILDDGSYHYVLTAMAEEAVAGSLQQTWNGLFSSFGLEEISTAP